LQTGVIGARCKVTFKGYISGKKMSPGFSEMKGNGKHL
jgi:hypothetical protein